MNGLIINLGLKNIDSTFIYRTFYSRCISRPIVSIAFKIYSVKDRPTFSTINFSSSSYTFSTEFSNIPNHDLK